jgi:hypothetical protein
MKAKSEVLVPGILNFIGRFRRISSLEFYICAICRISTCGPGKQSC